MAVKERKTVNAKSIKERKILYSIDFSATKRKIAYLDESLIVIEMEIDLFTNTVYSNYYTIDKFLTDNKKFLESYVQLNLMEEKVFLQVIKTLEELLSLTNFKIVEEDPARFKSIPEKYRTKELCELAVRKYPTNITYIKNPSTELVLLALELDHEVIRYMFPSEFTDCKLQAKAVEINPLLYWQFKNPEEVVSLAAVKTNGDFLKYISVQTLEICKAAIKERWSALKHVQYQTFEICKYAIDKNYRALKYISVQTPEICKYAVEKKGRALKFVDKKTLELCISAVNQDWFALIFVPEEYRNKVLETTIMKKG